MTISAVLRTMEYLGDDVSTAFAVPFQFINAADLAVYSRGADRVETLLSLGVGYTVSGGGGATGTVTAATAPETGTWLVIRGDLTVEQTVSYTPNGTFPAKSHEAALDRLTIAAQEADMRAIELTRRSVLARPGQAAPALPLLEDLEGHVLGMVNGAFVPVPNGAAPIAADLIRAENAALGAEASEIAAETALAGINAIVPTIPITVSKPVDQSVTSSTVLVNDTYLSIPILENQLISLEGVLNYSASAAGDLKWRLIGSVAAAAVQINRQALAPGDSAYSGLAVDTAYHTADVTVLGASGSGSVYFDATIQNGPDAGFIRLQFAQNTSDATATKMKAGSRFIYKQLPSAVNVLFGNRLDGAIARLGDYTTGVVSSHNYAGMTVNPPIANSYWEVMIRGTGLDMQCLVGDYSVSIDNAPAVIVTAPAGWNFVPIYSNLPDQTRRVRIQSVTAAQFIDTDIPLRISGSAPLATRPPNIPKCYRLYDAAYTAYIAKDGSPDQYEGMYGAGKPVATMPTGNAFGQRFGATTTSISAWVYDATGMSPLELVQDGVVIATYVYSGQPASMRYVTFATGLTGLHQYEIRPVANRRFWYIYEVFCDGLELVAHPAKSLDVWFGDSNIEGFVDANAKLHGAFLLSQIDGTASRRIGSGGQTVATWGVANVGLINALTQTRGRIINASFGANDVYFGTPLPTFRTAYTNMLALQRAGSAGAQIVAVAIHPHTRNSLAQIAAYNAEMQAAVAARVTAGDSNVVFVDTTGWPITCFDPVHIDDNGWNEYATRLALAI